MSLPQEGRLSSTGEWCVRWGQCKPKKVAIHSLDPLSLSFFLSFVLSFFLSFFLLSLPPPSTFNSTLSSSMFSSCSLVFLLKCETRCLKCLAPLLDRNCYSADGRLKPQNKCLHLQTRAPRKPKIKVRPKHIHQGPI